MAGFGDMRISQKTELYGDTRPACSTKEMSRDYPSSLQGSLPVVDDNQKVVGALPVVGATKMSKFPQKLKIYQILNFAQFEFLQKPRQLSAREFENLGEK
jgi:hypothetical protein